MCYVMLPLLYDTLIDTKKLFSTIFKVERIFLLHNYKLDSKFKKTNFF